MHKMIGIRKRSVFLSAVCLGAVFPLLCQAAVYVLKAGEHQTNPPPAIIDETRGAINATDVVLAFGDRWKVKTGSYQVRILRTGFGPPLLPFIDATRSYHIFAIPALAPGETVISVTLSFPHPGGLNPSYDSPDPSETVGLWDIDPANFADLMAPSVTEGTDPRDIAVLAAMFADIGSGVSYGSFVSSPANNGTTQVVAMPALETVLETFGLAGGGNFGVGASVITPTGGPVGDVEERVFRGGGLGASPTLLTITTEDPPAPADPKEIPMPLLAYFFAASLIVGCALWQIRLASSATRVSGARHRALAPRRRW
ncbi:MAG: hypothetical protein AAF384_18205 [Pseudomonadota bacterium]